MCWINWFVFLVAKFKFLVFILVRALLRPLKLKFLNSRKFSSYAFFQCVTAIYTYFWSLSSWTSCHLPSNWSHIFCLHNTKCNWEKKGFARCISRIGTEYVMSSLSITSFNASPADCILISTSWSSILPTLQYVRISEKRLALPVLLKIINNIIYHAK